MAGLRFALVTARLASAGLHVADLLRDVAERDRHLAGDERRVRRTAALELHRHDVDVREQVEELARNVRVGADACGGVEELAGFAFARAISSWIERTGRDGCTVTNDGDDATSEIETKSRSGSYGARGIRNWLLTKGMVLMRSV
jgi:hypothetical protein